MRYVYVILISSILVGASLPGQNADIRNAAKTLSSDDYLDSTEAARDLFAAGEPSIPFLIANFSNRSKFTGLCGNKVRGSSVDFDSGLDVDLVPSESDQEERQNLPTVRDISLYLLIAILKNDLYFAESCEPIVLGENTDASVDAAAGKIAILYVQNELNGSEFSAEEVEGIFKECNVVFH